MRNFFGFGRINKLKEENDFLLMRIKGFKEEKDLLFKENKAIRGENSKLLEENKKMSGKILELETQIDEYKKVKTEKSKENIHNKKRWLKGFYDEEMKLGD